MNMLWCPIKAEEWRSTPCISGRVATQEDVAAGRAVFYINGVSMAAKFDLPHCAMQLTDSGSEIPVVVIQAEIASTGTVLGVRPLTEIGRAHV